MSRARLVQGVHVAEHVLLTLSFTATGKAHGVSTLFGNDLVAARVLFHFGINLVATGFVLAALHRAIAVSRSAAAFDVAANELFVSYGERTLQP